MHHKWRGLPKLVAIIGGFLVMMGIVLLGMAALAVFGWLDAGMLLERKYVLVFSLVMVAVGSFDIFSSIIIARW